MQIKPREVNLKDNPYLLDYWFKFTIYERPNTQDKGYITNLVYTYLGNVDNTFEADLSTDLSLPEYNLSSQEQESIKYFLKTGGQKVYLNQRTISQENIYPSKYDKITSDKFEDTTNGATNTDAVFILELNEDGKGLSTYTATDIDGNTVEDKDKEITWTQNDKEILVTLGTDINSGAQLPQITLVRNEDNKTFITEDGIKYSLEKEYEIAESSISNPYKVKTQNGWEDFWFAGFTHLSAIEQDKYPKTTSGTYIDPVGGVFGFYTPQDKPLELRPRMFSMVGESKECNALYFLADALRFGNFSLMQFKINSSTTPISNTSHIPAIINAKNCFYFVWANQNTSGMASIGGKAFSYYYLEESLLFDLRQDLAVWESTGERVYDNAELMAIGQITDKRLQVYVDKKQMVSFEATIVPLVKNQDPSDIDLFLANNVQIQFELPRPIFRVNFNVNIEG